MYFTETQTREDLERDFQRLMRNHRPDRPDMREIKTELHEICENIIHDYNARLAAMNEPGPEDVVKYQFAHFCLRHEHK